MFVTTRSLERDPVINRIFDVLGSLNGDDSEASWVPPVDIFEDAEAIRIIAEVPGGAQQAAPLCVEEVPQPPRQIEVQVASQ